MTLVCCSKVTQNLRDMLIGKSTAGFQFDNEAILDHEIGVVVAKNGAVVVPHGERTLLNHDHTVFAE